MWAFDSKMISIERPLELVEHGDKPRTLPPAPPAPPSTTPRATNTTNLAPPARMAAMCSQAAPAGNRLRLHCSFVYPLLRPLPLPYPFHPLIWAPEPCPVAIAAQEPPWVKVVRSNAMCNNQNAQNFARQVTAVTVSRLPPNTCLIPRRSIPTLPSTPIPSLGTMVEYTPVQTRNYGRIHRYPYYKGLDKSLEASLGAPPPDPGLSNRYGRTGQI